MKICPDAAQPVLGRDRRAACGLLHAQAQGFIAFGQSAQVDKAAVQVAALRFDGAAALIDDAIKQQPKCQSRSRDTQQRHSAGCNKISLQRGIGDIDFGHGDDLAGPVGADRAVDFQQRQTKRMFGLVLLLGVVLEDGGDLA